MNLIVRGEFTCKRGHLNQHCEFKAELIKQDKRTAESLEDGFPLPPSIFRVIRYTLLPSFPVKLKHSGQYSYLHSTVPTIPLSS